MDNKNYKTQKGFTLLELLIVIAIIAILSVVLIYALNPAEALRKSRDVQRISDLNTLKSALTYYMVATSTPDLDGALLTSCLGVGITAAQVSYSLPRAAAICGANITEGGHVTVGSRFRNPAAGIGFCRYVATTALATGINGAGWIPVNLWALTGSSSPIAYFPLDPTNTIGVPTAPVSTDLVYRYACQNNAAGTRPKYVFELNAQLESRAYTVIDNKRAKDGGDNVNYYEVGSSLRLLGNSNNY